MGPRFSDLLGRFTDSVRSQLARIREEGRAGDRDTAFEAVHSLKNTAGDLGARSLHLAAQAMERSMRSGGDWQQLVPELEAIGQLAIEAAQTISEREGK
jgi:HPt (histidine-containing phosphotransfer) domain-containing protein